MVQITSANFEGTRIKLFVFLLMLKLFLLDAKLILCFLLLVSLIPFIIVIIIVITTTTTTTIIIIIIIFFFFSFCSSSSSSPIFGRMQPFRGLEVS
jgi:hypothetical protein